MLRSTTTIKEYAYSLGFDIARITDAQGFPEAERVIKERIAEGLMDGLPWFTEERAAVSCYPDALLPEAKSIISLAMFYLTQQPDDQEGDTPRGRVSRYAWGEDYHEVIKPKLRQFAAWLREYARDEMSDNLETRIFVDTGRMVDRAGAERAGFGCDICQQVCPVNHVVEKRLAGIIEKRGNGAQPIGVHPREEFRPRAGIGSSPELIPLLSLTEEQFRERFRLSPIRRTKRRGLLRNVCVALGNSKDQQAVPPLIGALHDYEPLIRGHAAWALGKIGGEQAKKALEEALSTEEHEEVRKEIRCALGEFL